MVELGGKYKDVITGFEGIATGRVQYLTGCNQILLNPSIGADGNLRDAQWFDEQRLERVGVSPAIKLENGLTPGADKQAPKY